MKISEKNVFKHELIGTKVKIVASSCKSLIGLQGTIIDESKKMLIIQTSGGIRKVPKNTSIFLLTFPDGKKVKLDGRRIVERPEERIKRG